MKSRYFPFPLEKCGVLAQLVERLNGIEEVRGSNPLGSISLILNGSRNIRIQVTTYPRMPRASGGRMNVGLLLDQGSFGESSAHNS
jgi:hypothetical protein